MSFSPPSTLETSLQDKIIGLLILSALILVGYLFYLNDEQSDDSNWISFQVAMSETYDVGPGATIDFKGINIGSVHTIELMNNGRVLFTIWLHKEYENFYVNGSKIIVDSTIGLGNVLSGSGLVFENGESNIRLQPGSLIAAEEPKALNDLLQEWNVEQVAAQVISVLDNLEDITATISRNQKNVDMLMSNLAQISLSIQETTQTLPTLVDQVQAVVVSVNTSINDSKALVKSHSDNLDELARQSITLLTTSQHVLESAQPIFDELPTTLEAIDVTLYESTLFIQKLNNHWLFGNKNENIDMDLYTPLPVYSIDDSLYHNDNSNLDGLYSDKEQ